MELNEIKKDLYKQKPMAQLISVTREKLLYSCEIIEGPYPIYFSAPISDIGDAVFYPEMASQLLIRYIVEQS